jgi:hypothetical protein
VCPWYTRQTFDHVRNISDDDLPDTFNGWKERAQRDFAKLQAIGLYVEKIVIDPDELLAFARKSHGGKINEIVRHDFATVCAVRKYGGREDSDRKFKLTRCQTARQSPACAALANQAHSPQCVQEILVFVPRRQRLDLTPQPARRHIRADPSAAEQQRRSG